MLAFHQTVRLRPSPTRIITDLVLFIFHKTLHTLPAAAQALFDIIRVSAASRLHRVFRHVAPRLKNPEAIILSSTCRSNFVTSAR